MSGDVLDEADVLFITLEVRDVLAVFKLLLVVSETILHVKRNIGRRHNEIEKDGVVGE